jgi:hypothetical protein
MTGSIACSMAGSMGCFFLGGMTGIIPLVVLILFATFVRGRRMSHWVTVTVLARSLTVTVTSLEYF